MTRPLAISNVALVVYVLMLIVNVVGWAIDTSRWYSALLALLAIGLIAIWGVGRHRGRAV